MKAPIVVLLALMLAGPVSAQIGTAGQDPTTGPLPGGGDPTGQLPVKPRGQGGGDYSGPGDTVPPGQPGGSPPVGGPGGEVPGAPPPGATPPTPDQPPAPPGGTDGGTSAPPPALGPIDPSTTSALLGLDLATWNWWWELNKEPFLVSPDSAAPQRPVTGSDAEFLGRGEARGGSDGRPNDIVLFGKVVPALLRTLENEKSDDLLAASALALARIGAGREADKKGAYAAVLRKHMAEGDLALAEIAVLSLGILGDEASAPVLADVLVANRDSRDLLGGRRPSTRVRAFAAYALGLIGATTTKEDVRRYVLHQLVWCLETDRTRSADLAAACVNGLGIVPIGGSSDASSLKPGAAQPPGSSLAAEVDYLLSLLEDRRKDRRVRAQVPIALGRLLQSYAGPDRAELKGAVSAELFGRIAAHRREPREVVQSCVIALGQLGDNDTDDLDRRIRRTLVRIEDRINDIATRQFAIIALGRATGRAGENRPDPLREERAYLLHELGRGGTTMRPWAALALGLSERGASDDADARRALRLVLADARTDREVGAYAIGTGLARDTGATDALLTQLGDRGDQATRGYIALGIGLAPIVSAEDRLLELLRQARFQPDFLRDAAISLELLGSAVVVPRLIELLTEARSLSSQTSVGLALARSKDGRAVAPLLEVLDDSSATSAARSYAAAALGWLGDDAELPWNALYSVDANIHAAPETLFNPQGNGLLNFF